MTLLREIQVTAVDSSKPITDLLHRCKLLAARLGSREFSQWVDRELDGYPSKEELPEYRIGEVRSLGHFVGFGGSGVTNAPIPPSNIPEKFRHLATTAYMLQPIGALEDLLRKDDTGNFQSPWPADLIKIVSRDIYQHMNCMSAWQEIPRGMVIGVTEAVRNRALSFVLDIEKLAPDAGEAPAGAPQPIPEAQVHTIFQTNIYGGTVGNVSTGGHGITQQIESLVSQGDFASLANQLEGLGFSESEIGELKRALAADAQEKKVGIGRAVAAWIGKGITKAGEGVLKVGVEVASKVLPTLINGYLGLPK